MLKRSSTETRARDQNKAPGTSGNAKRAKSKPKLPYTFSLHEDINPGWHVLNARFPTLMAFQIGAELLRSIKEFQERSQKDSAPGGRTPARAH
jgi:hypothetical protein